MDWKKNLEIIKTHPIKSFVLFIILFALIGVVFDSGEPTPASSPTPAPAKEEVSDNLKIGEEGRLVSDLDEITVAIDEKALDDFIDAAIAKDTIGYTQMLNSGQLFLVPKNTKVLVLDNKLFTTKIRILEGEHYGKSGWVPFEKVAR